MFIYTKNVLSKAISFVIIISVLLAILFPHPAIAFRDKIKPEWKGYKSSHFIVNYHPSISKKYIREFTRRCEYYYNKITERLGFNRFDFWLWENRANIYIYKTRQQYTETTQRPLWSGGSVHIKSKSISTFYFQEDFFDSILPHELGHIVLREFIGMKTKTPLWFDEGVACANEKNSYLKYFLLAKGFIDKKIYIPVPKLEKLNKDEVKVPTVFYTTAASLIIFLLEKYKARNFTKFCRELKGSGSFYGAMDKIYGIKDAQDLDEKFLSFMQSKSYREIINRGNFSVEW